MRLHKNVDLSRLPPCQVSLWKHFLRANYRMCIYKRAKSAQIDATNAYDGHGFGWKKDEDGMIVPLWYEGYPLPESLLELMSDSYHTKPEIAMYEEYEDMETCSIADEDDVDSSESEAEDENE